MQTERKQIENAIRGYAILHEITETEALGFLARRSGVEIIFDLLGLSATETMSRTVSYQEKEMLVSVFEQKGFRLRGLRTAI